MISKITKLVNIKQDKSFIEMQTFDGDDYETVLIPTQAISTIMVSINNLIEEYKIIIYTPHCCHDINFETKEKAIAQYNRLKYEVHNITTNN